MVLDHATPQDLLLWQRVNKAWQAAIRRSPRIQERLFFRIRETCKEVYDSKSREIVLVKNTCKTVFDKNCVVWNPFLRFFARVGGHSFSGHAFDGKASYPTASWREMYLTSPAMTELRTMMIILGQRRKEDLYVNFPVACETGITIGQFANALKEHIARHTEASEFIPYFIIS